MPGLTPTLDRAVYNGSLEDYNGFLELVDTLLDLILSQSIVHNCSFWDKLGVGFLGGGESRNCTPSGTTPPLRNLADASFPMWRPIDANQDSVNDYRTLRANILDEAVNRAVVDAARMLDQEVARELAVTDSTKSTLGALQDLTVVSLGIAALASGRAQVELWFAIGAGKVWRWCAHRMERHAGLNLRACRLLVLAKVTYGVVVLLSLVLTPAANLAAERAAREQNAQGTTSKIGLLAAEVEGGMMAGPLPDLPFTVENDTGPYMLIGVVTVRLTSQYDERAMAINTFSVALAAAGTVVVWLQSCCRTSKDLSDLLDALTPKPQSAVQLAPPGPCAHKP